MKQSIEPVDERRTEIRDRLEALSKGSVDERIEKLKRRGADGWGEHLGGDVSVDASKRVRSPERRQYLWEFSSTKRVRSVRPRPPDGGRTKTACCVVPAASSGSARLGFDPSRTTASRALRYTPGYKG